MPRKVTETPVDLWLWPRNGQIFLGNDPKAPSVSSPRVEVGRTDSKRRLGFAVEMTARTPSILFTLDRVQIKNLRDHLTYQLRRVRK